MSTELPLFCGISKNCLSIVGFQKNCLSVAGFQMNNLSIVGFHQNGHGIFRFHTNCLSMRFHKICLSFGQNPSVLGDFKRTPKYSLPENCLREISYRNFFSIVGFHQNYLIIVRFHTSELWNFIKQPVFRRTPSVLCDITGTASILLDVMRTTSILRDFIRIPLVQ